MVHRSLPLIGVVLTLAIAFVWRPWLQHRRHGTWGIHLFGSGNLGQLARDAAAALLFGLFAAQAVVAAWWPERLSPLLAADNPIREFAFLTGAVLTFAGLVLLVTAQLDLGASWRVGIDSAAKPGLVTTGLYGFSRNPIFAALLAIVAGGALMLPTLLSAALVIGTYLEVRVQTRAEEAYLLRTYGDAYRHYAAGVGRFLPGIGRLL